MPIHFKSMIFIALLLALEHLSLTVEAAESPQPIAPDARINEKLCTLIDQHQVPGMVAGIVQGTDLIAVGAAGVRKLNSQEPVTVNDKMHLGSCTKAMTATLLAKLVDDGKLSWEATLASIFLDEISDVHPDYHSVTLAQLLMHRGSLPANAAWNKFDTRLTTPQQRLTLLRTELKEAPSKKPGTDFLYSNFGYALAGAMAEKVTGRSWEKLMQTGLFEPLDMASAGFGPPGTINAVDQPWGHASHLGFLMPMQHDNPASLGPAGTVHASVPDWAKFASLHLQGARGQAKLLHSETFTRLQTAPENGNYAMGWLVTSPERAKGRTLAHDGSNTMWYSSIWILPERDLALLVVANRADEPARKACHDAVRSLLEYYDTVLSKP